MKHTPLLLWLSLVSISLLHADDKIAGGRVQDDGFDLDLYVGLGQISSLSGSVLETANGSLISGALNTDLGELGINDGSETTLIGGKLSGKWFTLLMDVRYNKIDASGTADSDIRINVDGVSFGAQDLQYLLIPVGTDFTVDSQSNWLGLGLRFTPLTFNPQGQFRFTPWLHVGFQYVDTSFNIDSGSSVGVDVPGFGNRRFAIRGQASGDSELIIFEYGVGGELRYRFHESGQKGIEIVASGTYKILNFEGSLSDIGFDDNDFDDLLIDYQALNLSLEVHFPIEDYFTLTAGIFTEQVDANIDLDSKPSVGTFRREVDGEYTLNGFRVGVQF